MAAGAAGPLPGVPAPQLPVPVPVPREPTRTSRSGAWPPRARAADWRVDVADGAFAISLPDSADACSRSTARARLIAADRAAPAAPRFTFEPRSGCARYPEVEIGATGAPSRGASPWGAVRGPDRRPHAHDGLRVPRRPGALRAALAPLRRRLRAGRLPRPRAPAARGAVVENTLSYGNPRLHDTTGWPTFKDWPQPRLADPRAELLQVARARLARRAAGVREPAGRQRGALRALSAQEELLQRDGRRAAAGKRIRELQDYIDAQNGGPGKGWFRIVTSPYEARRVINEGKLAVVLGIEVSKLFDCGVVQRAGRVHRASRSTAARRGLRHGRARHGARQQVRQRARAASPATTARPASSSTPATRSRPASSGR